MYDTIQKCIGLQSFSGEPEVKKPLWKPRRRWEDSIKMDLMGVGCVVGDWMCFAEDRGKWLDYVSVVVNFFVP